MGKRRHGFSLLYMEETDVLLFTSENGMTAEILAGARELCVSGTKLQTTLIVMTTDIHTQWLCSPSMVYVVDQGNHRGPPLSRDPSRIAWIIPERALGTRLGSNLYSLSQPESCGLVHLPGRLPAPEEEDMGLANR